MLSMNSWPFGGFANDLARPNIYIDRWLDGAQKVLRIFQESIRPMKDYSQGIQALSRDFYKSASIMIGKKLHAVIQEMVRRINRNAAKLIVAKQFCALIVML